MEVMLIKTTMISSHDTATKVQVAFWLALCSHFLYMDPDKRPLPVFVVSTARGLERSKVHLFLILQWGMAESLFSVCTRVTPISRPLLTCPRCGWVIYVWWITFRLADRDDRMVVVSRSERSWPKVNGPILTRLLHAASSGERSFALSTRMWGSVCERVRRHGFLACALHLAAVNISFSTERGHPQIFKGRNWEACFFI